jgi:hypothetical protein
MMEESPLPQKLKKTPKKRKKRMKKKMKTAEIP